MSKKIPTTALLDYNPFYMELYRPHARLDRLRWQVATALHDGLPDAVRECLIDELLTAESHGEKCQFIINRQTDEAIRVVLEAVKELAVEYVSPDGTIHRYVNVDKLDRITPKRRQS